MSEKPQAKAQRPDAPSAHGQPHPDATGSELVRLKHEAAQAQERYLRTLAEFENTKKRLHREQEEFVRYASETIVRDLLPIVDSLDQALVAVDPSTPPPTGGVARDSAPQSEREGARVPAGLRKQVDYQAVIAGIHLIRQQLLRLLDHEGVKRIPTVGEPFDPHRHEAVAQVETTDGTADETVVEEVQVGYTMHGKVIRPAMVKVAKKPETSDNRPQTSEKDARPNAQDTSHPNS